MTPSGYTEELALEQVGAAEHDRRADQLWQAGTPAGRRAALAELARGRDARRRIAELEEQA